MAEAARQLNYNASPRRRDKGPHLHELPLVRPRRGTQQQVHTRERVNLRPAEAVSLLPVVGLIVAAVLCVFIIQGYSQLNKIYADTIKARDQLRVLQQEEKTLSAQYEEIFDKAALDAAIEASGSTLGEVKSSQKLYVDLSEEDRCEVYHEEGKGILSRLRSLFSDSGE